jgi:hypothetical protein
MLALLLVVVFGAFAGQRVQPANQLSEGRRNRLRGDVVEKIPQRGRNGLGDATAFSNDRLNSVAIEQRHRDRPSRPSLRKHHGIELNACGGRLVQCPTEWPDAAGAALDVPIDPVIQRVLVP